MKKLFVCLVAMAMAQSVFAYSPEQIQEQITIANDTKTVQSFYVGGVCAVFGGYVLALAGAAQGNTGSAAAFEVLGFLSLGAGSIITFVTQGDLYDLMRRQTQLDQQLALSKVASN